MDNKTMSSFTAIPRVAHEFHQDPHRLCKTNIFPFLQSAGQSVTWNPIEMYPIEMYPSGYPSRLTPFWRAIHFTSTTNKWVKCRCIPSQFDFWGSWQPSQGVNSVKKDQNLVQVLLLLLVDKLKLQLSGTLITNCLVLKHWTKTFANFEATIRSGQ